MTREAASQELTLDQWCARLPMEHLVNRELVELKTTLELNKLKITKLREQLQQESAK